MSCAQRIIEKKTLKGLIEGRYGSMAFNTIANFFDAMQMPLPAEGEFTLTRDFGILVFLNDVGSVLRLTDNRYYPLLPHDNILQPYGSRTLGWLRADLNPGIGLCIDAEDTTALKATLNEDNINFHDDTRYNSGYLPGLGRNHAVVLDAGACKALYESAIVIAQLVDKTRTARSVQAEHYKPLRDAFDAVWPENASRPSGLATLWDACRDMKAKGFLVTSWLDSHPCMIPGFKNMVEGSTRYAEQWQAPTNKRELFPPSDPAI